MEELKPAEILKSVQTCGASFCTTNHHECHYGDEGCIDCVDRLEADFEALIAAGDDLIIRRTAPENKPLTLEQLRQMDGEPVFVASPGAEEYGHWVIVAGVDDTDGDKTLYCSGDFTCRDYGSVWLAYARKPEGSE